MGWVSGLGWRFGPAATLVAFKAVQTTNEITLGDGLAAHQLDAGAAIETVAVEGDAQKQGVFLVKGFRAGFGFRLVIREVANGFRGLVVNEADFGAQEEAVLPVGDGELLDEELLGGSRGLVLGEERGEELGELGVFLSVEDGVFRRDRVVERRGILACHVRRSGGFRVAQQDRGDQGRTEVTR